MADLFINDYLVSKDGKPSNSDRAQFARILLNNNSGGKETLGIGRVVFYRFNVGNPTATVHQEGFDQFALKDLENANKSATYCY